MRIDPINNSITSHMSADDSKPATQRGNRGAAHSLSPAVDVKLIDGILQLVAESSEIRESVVNDVKAKLQTGEYLSEQAAYDAASAILDL